MFNNPEISELKRRYNILLEQYQKIQGTIKVLRATADEMTTNIEKTEAERDKYKKAFESIFTDNIGDAWEKMSDEDKKFMTIDKKISFFENELNASKLYIRQKMLAQMKETTEENHNLKNELVKLKAQLKEKERQFKNAANINNVDRGNIKNSLVNDNEIGTSGIRYSKNKKNNINAAINTALNEIQKSNTPVTVGSNIDTAVSSDNTNTQKQHNRDTEATKPDASSVSMKHQVCNNPPKNTTSINSLLPTTEFFERFNKMAPEVQNKFKNNLPKLDSFLGNISFGKEIVLVIGNTGLYLSDDIVAEGIKNDFWEDKNDKKVRATLKEMINKNLIIKGVQLKAIGKGRPRDSYLLTPMSEAWYALTTYKDPVRSLSIIRAKEQKSVEHAELIQKIINVLNKHDYETYQEVPMVTSSIGEASIADISANKDEFINIRIECEMGNYDTPSYIYKFAKVLEVTDRLLVGVPTIAVKAHIEEVIGELIRNYYHGLDNFSKKGKFYKVFTLQELSKDPDLILPKKKGTR